MSAYIFTSAVCVCVYGCGCGWGVGVGVGCVCVRALTRIFHFAWQKQ